MITLFFVYALASVMVLVGMILHEVRTTRRIRDMYKHPHARQWRLRPHILIRSSEPDSLTKIYRNSAQFTSDHPSGKYVLDLRTKTTPSRDAILAAIYTLETQPHLPSTPLQLVLTSPTTLLQLLKNYYSIACAPFEIARSGWRVSAGIASFIVLSRNAPQNLWQVKVWCAAYDICALLLRLFTTLLALYALFLALAHIQLALFVVVVSTFLFYMVYAILTYPHLSMRDKFFYILLAPVSFGYLLIAPYASIARELRQKTLLRIVLSNS